MLLRVGLKTRPASGFRPMYISPSSICVVILRLREGVCCCCCGGNGCCCCCKPLLPFTIVVAVVDVAPFAIFIDVISVVPINGPVVDVPLADL